MMNISKILSGGFSLVLFLTSCSSEKIKDKNAQEYIADLISDQSSKVWVLDEQVVNNKKVSKPNRSEKLVMVFYDDGFFYLQNMSNIPYTSNTKGRYKVNDGKVSLKLSDNGNYNSLDVTHASKDSLVLEKNKDSTFTFMRMRLLPLGRPQKAPNQTGQSGVDLNVN